MPDIVSRIRVEVAGADQAVREIRKLAPAFDELSRPGAPGGDPFAAATAPAWFESAINQLSQNEEAHAKYRQAAREREQANSRSGLRGVTSQGFSMAESLSESRGGAFLGSAASSLANFITGPGGIALGIGSVLGFGIQKFADNAFARVENIWGTGMAQRLGQTFSDVESSQIRYGSVGIPMQAIQSFYHAASHSGLNMRRRGAGAATDLAMEVMAGLGVDPTSLANLLGVTSRAGLQMDRYMGDQGIRMYSRVAGAFGQENVTLYLQEMARGITDMATKGISLEGQETGINWQSNLLLALRQFGGLSPEGAIAASGALRSRAISAATLQRPEDLIAFQAMRREGMGFTDTRLMMEQQPELVTRKVFEYLQSVTQDRDVLVSRMQSYLGSDTTTSMALNVIKTLETMAPLSDSEFFSKIRLDDSWLGEKVQSGGFIYRTPRDPARMYYAGKQTGFLKPMERLALEATTGIGRYFVSPSGRFNYDAMSRGLGRASAPEQPSGFEDIMGAVYPGGVPDRYSMFFDPGWTRRRTHTDDIRTLFEQIATHADRTTVGMGMAGYDITQPTKSASQIRMEFMQHNELYKAITTLDSLKIAITAFVDELARHNYLFTDGTGE